MAGFFLVEDDAERALGLPAGEQDVALLLQDRRRASDNSLTYAPTPMDLMSGYLGNTVLVNGTPDAELSVTATRPRFRILNGSNARGCEKGEIRWIEVAKPGDPPMSVKEPAPFIKLIAPAARKAA